MKIIDRVKKIFRKEEKTDIQKARELHKKLKAVWDKDKYIRGGKTIELQEVYPSRSGSLFYIHKNILDLHVARQMELAKATQRLSFNVDSNTLDVFYSECHKANNRGDQQRVSDLLNDLNIRRKRIVPAECFINISLCLIYRHDENPYTFEPKMRDAKLREINKCPELRSFFLSEGYAEGRQFLKEDNLKDWNVRNLQDFLQKWMEEEMQKVSKNSANTT